MYSSASSFAVLMCIIVFDCVRTVPVSSSADKVANRRALFDCRVGGQSCKWYERCCGDLTCQRDGGRLSTGRCVDCVDLNGPCVRDSECCQGGGILQCDKDGFSVNGKCKPPRENGERCYEIVGNSQCASDYCEMGLTRGVCAPKPKELH